LQGSAADIIKLAMIHIDRWLQEIQPKTKMIMQVHDELVFEAPDDEVDMIAAKVRELMSSVVKLDVPLLVSVGIGDNWDKASEH
jgi:DNA polymerase-1